MIAVAAWVSSPTGMGSGTLVDSPTTDVGLILTCKHVADRRGAYQVRLPGQTTQGANFLKADPKADLAFLIIGLGANQPKFPAIAERTPARGCRVYQAGYPHGRGPAQQTGLMGRITGKIPIQGGKWSSWDNLTCQLRAQPGDSGSGVFTERFELCAVIWGGPPNGMEWLKEAACVSTEDIRRFTEAVYAEQGWLTPWCRPGRPGKPKPNEPPNPYYPGQPPTMPPAEPSPPGLGGILDRLKVHEEHLKDLRDKLQILPEAVGHLGDLKKNLADLKADFLGLRGKVDSLPPELKGRFQGLEEKLKGLGLDLDGKILKLDHLKILDGKLAGVLLHGGESSAAISQIASLLPWVIGIGAAGAGSPILYLAIMLIGKLIGRRVHQRLQPDAPLSDKRIQVAVSSPSPATPPPDHEIKFVGVEKPSEELERILKAMEICGRDYPGTVGTLNLLQGLAKQLKTSKT